MYEGQHYSLHQLYLAAEEVYGQLRKFAEEVGIGSASLFPQYGTQVDDVATLQLHNGRCLLGRHDVAVTEQNTVYYLAVLLAFRPFLVAEAALRSRNSVRSDEEMWLRQACRIATDTAQDLLVFLSKKYRTSNTVSSPSYEKLLVTAADRLSTTSE